MAAYASKFVTQEEAVENAIKLHSIYAKKCQFPPWSAEYLVAGKFQGLRPPTLLCHKRDDKTDCLKVAIQREPVNIAMNQHYNTKKMFRTFGYEYGAYNQSTKTKLMPNIAIICETWVNKNASTGEDDIPTKRMRRANVINLIGYAFDSRRQPDYAYFADKNGYIDLERLEDAYADMWFLAFYACVHWLDIGTRERILRYAGVGTGAFRPQKVPEHRFFAMIDRAFDRARARAEAEFPVSVLVVQMGNVPDEVFALSEDELARSVFVNAWDCWSMVGNGNYSDRSLDGFWGRHTSMALQCWPMTSPDFHVMAVK